MRMTVALFLISLMSCQAVGQDARVAAALRDAQELIEHMQDFDTEEVAALLYVAPMIRMGADPEQLRQRAATLDANLRSTGAKYKKFTLQSPTELFSRPEGLFVLIPYSSVMIGNGQKIQQDAFFIAFSDDEGLSWKFLDGIATARVPIDVILPEYEGPNLPEVRRFPVQ